MVLEDFISKYVIIQLKDGEKIEGILIEIKDYDDDINYLYYTILQIRIDSNNYRTVYLNEIETIGELA